MALIINIETSSKTCSVALTKDGVVEFQLEDTEGMNHAVKLAPFVERCMDEVNRKGKNSMQWRSVLDRDLIPGLE